MQTRLPAVSVQPGDDASADGVKVIRRDAIDPGTEYVAPSNDLDRRLSEMWQDILKIDKVGINDNFFELGGDSLQAIDLFIRLEYEFSVALTPSTIIGHPTIALLSELLAESAKCQLDQCLVLLQPDGAEPPLFLIHDGSGYLFSYRRLLERLGTSRKIYGFQYPDQGRESPQKRSVTQIAEMYVAALKHVQANGPYFLAGYSFGGYIAYEMARLLNARGDRVGLLALIDPRLHGEVLRGPRLMLRKLARHLALMSDQRPSQWPMHVAGAIRRDIERLWERRPQTEFMAPVNLPPRMQNLANMFRVAYSEYVALPYEGSANLLRTDAAPWSRRCLGWSDLVKGGVEIFDIPGTHETALLEPAVALVAAYLQLWIDRAAKA
jgi:thioesterase domain-containing protein/acyl carrier protein